MNTGIGPQGVIAALTLAVTILIISILGAVVFARTYRKRYGLYFLLTMIGIILWCAGDLMVLFADAPAIIRAGELLFYIGPMLIPVFIWFFAISFPENKKVPDGYLYGAVTTIVIYALLFSLKFDFFVKQIDTSGVMNVPVPQSPGFLVYAAFFSVIFMLAYYAFYKKMHALKAVDRTQVSYTFYGALIASIPALMTNLSLPLMGVGHLIWLGPFFTLFFAAAVSVAIVKHKLFDIRPVIVRTLGYTLTILAVATIYGFVIFSLVRVIFDLQLSLAVQIVIAVSTGVAALLFQNLKQWIDNYTRQLFYRDSYDPQTLFDEYNKQLVSTVDLDELLQSTADIIVKYFKSESCHVGVKDGSPGEYRIVGTSDRVYSQADIAAVRMITPKIRRPVIVTDDLSADYDKLKLKLRQNDISVMVRLTTEFDKPQEGIGYMVLGPKKSGNQYTAQDAQVLEALANELIIALQNALRFEEIERFNQTLQAEIEQATRKLRQSNLKLKKLDQTKDDFISMTSHQLRTPLSSIKGYVSLVMDGDAGEVTETQRKLLAQAFGSAQKMVYLVADLLNVSRLKTGKFVIERVPSDLSKVVTDEIAQLKEEFSARDLTVEYAAPKEFPVLPLDETKTRQVIMNFLDNAIYYTPKGGHVKVELEELPDRVEFRVIDNGIGVPKSERPHLFSKFYRAKNAQRARPDGTGLGLYMASKVVIAQGGAIIFISKEGQGSTFGFRFPKDMPEGQVPFPAQSHDE